MIELLEIGADFPFGNGISKTVYKEQTEFISNVLGILESDLCSGIYNALSMEDCAIATNISIWLLGGNVYLEFHGIDKTFLVNYKTS